MSDEQAPCRRRRFNVDDRRRIRAAEMQLLLKLYARKAQKRKEPNDRARARGVKEMTRRLRPEVLDALLREGE